MPGRTLEDLGPDARVRAGVAHDPRPDAHQSPVRVAADRVGHRQRVTLGVEAQALAARQGDQHRPAGDLGEQRRVALDAEVLLAAERSAGGDLGHPDRLLRPAEDRGDLAPVLPGALARREDPHRRLGARLAARHGEGGFGLEERMLDPLRLERLARDMRRAGERGVDVASADDAARQEVAAGVHERSAVGQRGDRVGHRIEHVVLHLDKRGRRPRRGTRRRGHPRQHVTDVARGLALGHEQRPVGGQQALDALARDIAPGDDGEDARMGGRGGRVDPPDDGSWVIGEADRPVDHAGHDHVRDEGMLAEHRSRAVVAPDSRSHAGPGCRLSAGEPGPSLGGDRLDRLDDLLVAGAATQVAGQRAGDLLAPSVRRPGRAGPPPS